MSASSSGKRIVPLIAAPGELRTPLMAATLPLLLPIPQFNEVQINNAGGDNLNDNNIAIAITPI